MCIDLPFRFSEKRDLSWPLWLLWPDLLLGFLSGLGANKGSFYLGYCAGSSERNPSQTTYFEV